jgi:hypothetical protein
MGYRMNDKEDIILLNGQKILKQTLLEVSTLNTYLRNPHALNKSNIVFERVKFQVDGSTILHMYCLDYPMLKLILEFYSNYKPKYLRSILMKNQHGVTPLDMTI